MEIDVHHIKAHVTRTACTEHRVEVGSVVVHQSATLMYELGYLGNLLLKHTESVGVGHHHRSHGVVEDATKVVHIHKTLCGTLHLNNLQAANGSRGRIGAMSRVGDNHLGAL